MADIQKPTTSIGALGTSFRTDPSFVEKESNRKLADELKVSRQIGIMIDIESMDIGPRSVITQVAMQGYDYGEEELVGFGFNSHLPFTPQIKLPNPRTVSASTIMFWLKQSEQARKHFEKCLDDDPNSLRLIMQQFCYEISNLVKLPDSEYFIIARGPQFDIVNLESLLGDLGLAVPWTYDRVRDLRTVMVTAGVSSHEVPKAKGHVDHDAAWDVDFQIKCHYAAKRRIG